MADEKQYPPVGIVGEPAPEYGIPVAQVPKEGLWDTTSFALTHQAKSGVTMAKVQDIAKAMGLTMEEMADLLHVSVRTLQRRSASDIMSTPISERILQFEQLIEQGEFMFGHAQDFRIWMREPIPALGSKPPIDFLDTLYGVRLASKALGRLAMGVYS